MEIKRQLKNLDIKISKLARELSISRPTLDAYIESYENGKTLSNQLYQTIFDYLFSSSNTSAVEFAKKFDYVKRNFLQNPDNLETSREELLKNQIIDSLAEKNLSIEFLEFINLFVNNSQVELVDVVSQYFNYVNGLKLYSESFHNEQDTALFSLLFKIFKEYKDGIIQKDEESFLNFMNKNKKIFARKEKSGATDEVIEYLKLHIGDNSSLDLDYIKKLLNKKEN